MKFTKLLFAGAVCAMMAMASACSSKTETAATDQSEDATATEATEAAAPAAAADGVIELAAGEKLDLAKGLPVIVDFNATWCGPCKAFAPTYEEVAKEFAGKALFYSVDVDQHPELAAEYGVTSIPHVQFINPADASANTATQGLQTKEEFTKAVAAFIK